MAVGAAGAPPALGSTSGPQQPVTCWSPYWAWIRAVLLMTAPPGGGGGGARRPFSPDDVRQAALSLQVPLMGMDSQAHLLWVVVHYLTAPVPAGWLTTTSKSEAGEEASELTTYVNPQLGTRSTAHPLLPSYRETTRMFARFPSAVLASVEAVDALGWMHFVESDGGVPYYYNFRTGQLQHGFPDLHELAGASPLLLPRQANLVTDAYQRTVPAFAAAKSHTEMLLSNGVATAVTLEAASCPVRASRLWMAPLPLSQLLTAAQTLGIDPLSEPHLMWVAHLSLCLPLPSGWVEYPTDGADAASQRRRRAELRKRQKLAEAQGRGLDAEPPSKLPKVFYQHSLFGTAVTQWEPPQTSFCRGMLHALRKHSAAQAAAAQAAAQTTQHTIGGPGARGRRGRRTGGASSAAAAQPPQDANAAAAHTAEAIRQRLRKMQRQTDGAEIAYATALTGAKYVAGRDVRVPRPPTAESARKAR